MEQTAINHPLYIFNQLEDAGPDKVVAVNVSHLVVKQDISCLHSTQQLYKLGELVFQQEGSVDHQALGQAQRNQQLQDEAFVFDGRCELKQSPQQLIGCSHP